MKDKITIGFEEDNLLLNMKETINFNVGGVKLKLDSKSGLLQLLDNSDRVLSEVDFPTEKIITNVYYDKEKQELVLEFENSQEVRVPIQTDLNNYYTIEQIDNITNNINKELLLKENKSNLKALAYKDSLNKNDIGLGNVLNVESYSKQETYSKTEIDNINSKKVDKIQGKGLSTNDLTNELLSKLNSLSNYDDTNIQSQIDGIKQVLTSNDVDYDTLQELVNALKNNTSSIGDIFTALSKKANLSDVYAKSETYTKGEVDTALNQKANSSNVYTKTEINTKLEDYAIASGVDEMFEAADVELAKKANAADVYTKGEVDAELAKKANDDDVNTAMFAAYELINTKVDKVEGKQLSTNDYTTSEKQKLANLNNYDDSEIKQDIVDLENNKANKNELFSKDYNDLTNKPTIPTKLSDLELDIEVGGGDGVSEEEVMVIVNENSEEVDELEIEEVEDLGVEEITTLTLATSTNYDINSDEQIITPKAVKDIIENSSSNYDDTEIKQDILDLENNKADKNELFSKNYNDLTNKPTIPSTTNQLTNNSGFITNVVSDLVNYYLKTDTYSKTEIDNLVTSIPKFNIKVVTSLPTTNISTTTVYLKTIGNESSNLYEEFVYVDGLWEKLGTQTVDLTNYALKSSIPTKVSQLTNDNLYVDENKVEEILETNSKEVTSIDIGTSTNLDITNDNQVPTSLAVKNYIESKLGDIEAILDILNGEV